MSKRKGPSDENPNGGITDFLMGRFVDSKDAYQLVTLTALNRRAGQSPS